MIKKLAFLIILILTGKTTFSQGCSDAGFCSVGSLKHKPNNDSSNNTISVIVNNGVGDDNVFVSTWYLQYDRLVRKNFVFQAKINGNYASGNLGSVSGPGDLLLNIVAVKKLNTVWKLSGTLGIKVPLSNSDIEINTMPLPMQYQSSLGTFDAIAGITLSNNNWIVSTGYQHPLTTSNNNHYDRLKFPNFNTESYPPSYQLKRSADLLLKVGYNINAIKHLTISASILSIYHLKRDEFLNTINNKYKTIVGSEGLTVNAVLGAWYKKNKFSFGLITGRPFVVRDKRPDGLTRSIIVSPEIAFNF